MNMPRWALISIWIVIILVLLYLFYFHREAFYKHIFYYPGPGTPYENTPSGN